VPVLISAVGERAEVRLFPYTSSPSPASGDRRRIKDLTGRQGHRVVKEVAAEVDALLELNWPLVRAVAASLMMKPCLGGPDIDGLAQGLKAESLRIQTVDPTPQGKCPMKAHHMLAAAVLLCGWYLMTPPVVVTSSGEGVDNGAPFAEWNIYSAFDHAAECEAAENSLRQDIAELKKKGWSEIAN
jgi:hypothetical protein